MRWKRSSSSNPLVPVLAVAAEVELLGLPLLALPEQVELLVGEQLDLGGAVGGLLQRRVGGRLEVVPLGPRLGPGCLFGPHRLSSRLRRLSSWQPSQYTECDSPGASTTTFEEVFDSTSALKAAESVSIGGKVS